MKKINLENWVCVVPGEKTTTIAIFSAEPATKQIKTLVDLQLIFETANRNILNQQPIPHTLLVIPHNFYIHKEI